MDHPVLRLPDKLDLNHLLQCARRLDACRGSKAITLDMGGSRHFPPFPMLFLAAKILELREAYPDTRFDVKNYADHDYAAHMRFFKAAGFDIGNEPGEAKGSARYLPITALHRSELRRRPEDRFVELGDLVQRHADDIAGVVSQKAVAPTSSIPYRIASESLFGMFSNTVAQTGCFTVLSIGRRSRKWKFASWIGVSVFGKA
jgi:hypothetical protein